MHIVRLTIITLFRHFLWNGITFLTILETFLVSSVVHWIQMFPINDYLAFKILRVTTYFLNKGLNKYSILYEYSILNDNEINIFIIKVFNALKAHLTRIILLGLCFLKKKRITVKVLMETIKRKSVRRQPVYIKHNSFLWYLH